MKNAPARHLVTALKVTTTILLVALLMSRLDWSQAAGALETMNYRWFGAALLVFLTTSLLETCRLKVVFGYLGLKMWEAYKLQAIGYFWASFLPGQIGGDVYRLMVVKSVGGTVSQTIAALFALRAVALVVVAATAAIGAILVWPQMHVWARTTAANETSGLPNMTFVYLGLAAVVVAAAIAAALLRGRMNSRRIKKLMATLRLAVSQLKPRRIVVLFGLSACMHMCRVIMISALAHTIGIQISPDLLLFVASAAVLANHLPISFAGLGTREAAIVVLLLPLGVSYEEGTLVAVGSRAISVLFALWGGALFLLVRKSAVPAPGHVKSTG